MKNSIQLLCNNAEQTRICVQQLKVTDAGKFFTFERWVIFFYRVCILVFDHTVHGQKKYALFNLVRKLIYQFRALEQSDAFLQFLSRIGRTYTKTYSFLPSKDLLAQILICEKLDKYLAGRPIESFTKEELVNRLMEGDEYIEPEGTKTSKPKTVSQ